MRVAHDVGGDDRVLGVLENALELTLGGGLDGGLDGVDGDLLLGDEGQVGQRAGRGGDAHGQTVELALERGQDEGHGLGGTGLGGDHVQGGGASTAEVLVRGVEDALVTRVGVDGGHDAALDAEVLVENLGQGGEAVGGARGVGHDVHRGVVVVALVDTHDEGAVDVLGGGGDDNLLGTTVNVGLGLLAVGEEAGGLHDDLDAQVAPGQVGGVALSEHLDVLAVDGDAILVVGDLAVETTEDRVVLEQVGQGLVVRQVVDGDNLDVGALLEGGTEEVAADPAEAVNTNAGGHFVSS